MKNVPNKEINALAIPAIIAGLAEPIISLTDIALVGKNLDHHAIAGVGIASYTIILFIWVFSTIRYANTSMVSQLMGTNSQEKINIIASKSLLISFCIGVFILIISNIFAIDIFKYQNASGITLEGGLSYFRIRSFAIPFTLATLTLFGTFQGFQNTSWAMYITLLGGAVNLGLDFLLIGGTPFTPSMGIEGAAYASLVSQALMFAAAMYFFRKNFRFSMGEGAFFNKQVVSLFYMSIDLFLRAIALNIVFILTNKYATKYGDHHMAAHSILFWVWLLQSYIIDGFSTAGMALSGKIKGQKRYGLLYRLGMKLCSINLLISLILAVAFLAAYPVVSSFATDPKVGNIIDAAYYIMLLSFPMGAIAFTFDGIYIGIGKAYFLRNLLLISTFLIFIPCLYFLNKSGFSTNGIWISILAWLSFRAFVSFIHFQSRYQDFNKL